MKLPNFLVYKCYYFFQQRLLLAKNGQQSRIMEKISSIFRKPSCHHLLFAKKKNGAPKRVNDLS